MGIPPPSVLVHPCCYNTNALNSDGSAAVGGPVHRGVSPPHPPDSIAARTLSDPPGTNLPRMPCLTVCSGDDMVWDERRRRRDGMYIYVYGIRYGTLRLALALTHSTLSPCRLTLGWPRLAGGFAPLIVSWDGRRYLCLFRVCIDFSLAPLSPSLRSVHVSAPPRPAAPVLPPVGVAVLLTVARPGFAPAY